MCRLVVHDLVRVSVRVRVRVRVRARVRVRVRVGEAPSDPPPRTHCTRSAACAPSTGVGLQCG